MRSARLSALIVTLLAPAITAQAQSMPVATQATTYPAAPAGARVVDEGWFARPQSKIARPPLADAIDKAYVIPIHGPINDTLYQIVRRKITICKGRGAKLIVFDMHTLGGDSDAMNKIIQLILEDLRDVYTVAYVHPQAFSAGALISLACTEIAVSPSARIGAALGWIPGLELPDVVREKFDAASRSDVRAWAKQRGQWPAIWEAMVSVEVEVWLIRKKDTGQLRFVEAAAWRGLRGAPPTTRPAAVSRVPEAGWEFLRIIDTDEDLLSCEADEALYFGIADRALDNTDSLKAHFGIAELETLGDTWSEGLVAFLSLPIVTTILLIVGLMAFYSETRTPGLGVPALIAVICFAILLGNSYLLGLANWWELVLLALGLLLVALEIFVIPGFGVAGISGIICLLVGVAGLLVANPPDSLPLPSTALDWSQFETGLATLLIAFALSIPGAALISRLIPKIPGARWLVLAPAEKFDAGPLSEASPALRVSAGDFGVVEGTCRPVGKVRFGEHLLDALTEGETIEPGARVRVLHREGNRIVVEKVR